MRMAHVLAEGTRSPWLAVIVVLGALAYLGGQRLMDRGARLTHAVNADTPDDELIDL
jgi:hypothetical protein